MTERTQHERKKEKKAFKNKDKLRNFWDNINNTSINIIGIPKGEERKKGPESICEEIIDENLHNPGKEPDI